MGALTHVAIDGPAGSGKTTVARALAGRLGSLYLDTGAMYRALAFEALRRGYDPSDETALVALACERPVRIVSDANAAEGFVVYAGDERLGEEIYGSAVGGVVSVIAAHPRVRELMVERQRAIARSGPVVMAGRDIGTVVLPDASVKIFLTASVPERVRRRRAELAARGTIVDEATVRSEMEERDRLDTTRAVAPLRPAVDAHMIDSSGLGVGQVVDRIAELVERSMRSNGVP